MASIIKLKRSGTAGAKPAALEDGELALNQVDMVLYARSSGGIVMALAGRMVTDAFTYAGGSTLALSREPVGAVALYWAPSGGALVRVHPSRYSVSGKTLTLTAGQWSDLQSGDALVADYLGGAS